MYIRKEQWGTKFITQFLEIAHKRQTRKEWGGFVFLWHTYQKGEGGQKQSKFVWRHSWTVPYFKIFTSYTNFLRSRWAFGWMTILSGAHSMESFTHGAVFQKANLPAFLTPWGPKMKLWNCRSDSLNAKLRNRPMKSPLTSSSISLLLFRLVMFIIQWRGGIRLLLGLGGT